MVTRTGKTRQNLTAALLGKITVITGAGGVIGSATAEVFDAAGAEVVAVDVDAEALAQQGFSSKCCRKP